MMKTIFTTLFLLSSIILFMNASCSFQKEVVAFKIYSQEDRKLIKIKRNGSIIFNDKKVGVLREDKVLTNLDKDTLAYQDTNGIVYSREHEILGKVDDNGAIEIVQGDQFSWTADGKLQLKGDQSIRVEPNFKAFYDKASFLFIVYATISSTKEGTEIQIEGTEYE